MRTVVLLSILGLAAAGPSLSKQGDCLVDGTEAVSDAMDSAMYIWASLARCGHTGETIKCEVAITSAIESVNGMINVILKAVDKCHGLKTDHKKVGLAASKLTRAFAGAAAASGGLVQKCPSIFGGKPHGNNFAHGDAVFCTVNLKSTAKALFKAIKALMKVSKHGHGDAKNALKVVEAFAHLGQYLAGSLGHCTHTLDETKLGCGYYVQGLIADLTKVAEAGVALAKEAGKDGGDEGTAAGGTAIGGTAAVAPSMASEAPALSAKAGAAAASSAKAGAATGPDLLVYEIEEPYGASDSRRRRRRRKSDDLPIDNDFGRKYELSGDKKKEEDNAAAPISNLVLGAFLPVTAVVSFVLGRVFANRRERMTQSRQCLSDVE